MPDDHSLLAPDEPAAFRIERANGLSPFLLIADHAGARIPRRLGSLGLEPKALQSHIAWDIGAAAVAMRLASRLEACCILQTYSRLVIDCNRPPGTNESIVTFSDTTRIPGNDPVTPGDALARQREIFHPYHDRIRAELDARHARQQRTILISMHSFTPTFDGFQRPWHTGLLYNRDRRLADSLFPLLQEYPGLVIGDNEPYSVGDETDYSIPVHGERRGVLHAGIELRQDLIAEEAGQEEWADRLEQVLRRAGDILPM